MEKPKEKICQECSTPFWGSKDQYYCPKCSKKLRAQRVMRERTCIDCGATFVGGPKALRCPNCRFEQNNHVKQQVKSYGPNRSLGDTDKCVVCGKEYIVEAALQKYCSERCRKIGMDIYNKSIKSINLVKMNTVKKERRENQLYVCQYCKCAFKPIILTGRKIPSHIYCSDYCMKEQKKIQLCVADIKRGYHRNLQKYIDKRNLYREKVKGGVKNNE